jgi:ribosome-binding protein aMBF1 (putative translation factor)
VKHSRKLAIVPALSPEERRECERDSRFDVVNGRRELGLTQLGLAQKLTISVSSVEDYETGKTKVPGWVLKAIERLVKAARREAA